MRLRETQTDLAGAARDRIRCDAVQTNARQYQRERTEHGEQPGKDTLFADRLVNLIHLSLEA